MLALPGEPALRAARLSRPLPALAAGSADVTPHLDEPERELDVKARLGFGRVQVEDFPDAAETVGGERLDEFGVVLGVLMQQRARHPAPDPR